jgi:hypothetical protein
MGPVIAPLGTMASTSESLMTEKLDASTPPKTTLVVPVNVVPLIVTAVPTGPLVGLKLLMLGTTANGPIVAEPPAVVTAMLKPVFAAAGTVAVTCVSETTLNVAALPPMVTAEVCVRLIPVRVTVLPTIPLVGLTLVSCGTTR